MRLRPDTEKTKSFTNDIARARDITRTYLPIPFLALHKEGV